MHPDLRGKTAVITGSGKKDGIGVAIARKFASCGVHTIITDIASDKDGEPDIPDEMQEITTDLEEKFSVQAAAFLMDVTDPISIADTVSRIMLRFKSVDILVNNAGVALGVPSEVRNYDETAWVKTVDINLHGAFRVSKAFLPLMENRKASIINISSRAGKVAPLWNGAYAVSKAGLIMLTKVMALELVESGIRVNAVCPGLIMTGFQSYRLELEAEFHGTSVEVQKEALASRVPQNRLGTADEVADLVAYLASGESSYITGQAINVCGGLTMEL
jgi:3-oxoacyl-[acyl-carrier protein] reductase